MLDWAQTGPSSGAGLTRPQLDGSCEIYEKKVLGTPKPIPKARKFKPELLPQDHPLMGNKETVVEYAVHLGRRDKFIDGSLLSDHRYRVIMMYLQEASDAIGTDIEPGCTSHYKPEPSGEGTDTGG